MFNSNNNNGNNCAAVCNSDSNCCSFMWQTRWESFTSKCFLSDVQQTAGYCARQGKQTRVSRSGNLPSSLKCKTYLRRMTPFRTPGSVCSTSLEIACCCGLLNMSPYSSTTCRGGISDIYSFRRLTEWACWHNAHSFESGRTTVVEILALLLNDDGA